MSITPEGPVLPVGSGGGRPRAPRLARAPLLALLGTALAATAAADVPAWRLMSREGECHLPAVLARKDPAFAAVRTPDDLVAALRRQGQAPHVTEVRTDRGRMVQVDAPGRGLGVVFVEAGACPPAARR